MKRRISKLGFIYNVDDHTMEFMMALLIKDALRKALQDIADAGTQVSDLYDAKGVKLGNGLILQYDGYTYVVAFSCDRNIRGGIG
jgi:hypothetical protein